MTREDKLVQAVKQAIPWLVLLGDYIGNGTKDDPEGRCAAIAALHDALGADDVPNELHRPRRPPMSQACQLGYHDRCHGENTLGTNKCKCVCHLRLGGTLKGKAT